MQLPSWILEVKKLVTTGSAGEWCKLKYPGHNKGCPNYGKTDRCPPECKPVSDYFDLSKPLYLVHSEFDLDSHAARMKDKHPKWSDRQCRCVLYWQPRSRKQLKERIATALFSLPVNFVATTPEAMGVNVYATARLSGLNLERIRDLSICRHVALVGNKKIVNKL